MFFIKFFGNGYITFFKENGIIFFEKHWAGAVAKPIACVVA